VISGGGTKVTRKFTSEDVHHSWRQEMAEIHRRWERRDLVVYRTKVASLLIGLAALGWVTISVFGR
jgi:hypothetical protein